MKLTSKYSDMVLNLLVAVAISLVVNFSYLLLMLVDRNDMPFRPENDRIVQRTESGSLSISPDGHGYLVYENGDSVYVTQSHIRRLSLSNGDRLVADLTEPQREDAHPQLGAVKMRNGKEFDNASLYDRTPKGLQLALQLIYYLIVSFVLLSILTATRRNYSARRFAYRCLWCIAAAALLYLIAPTMEWRTGRIIPNIAARHMLDYILLLKWSFAVAVSMLYGRIYVLIWQRQAVELENEQLKNENLTTRYNMLVAQVNPHFFFNSLNSLAMLVREKDDTKALTYIDQLSYTFRYILQNGQSTLVPLDEELKFAEAYGYLFKIRYEDKLFFDMAIDEHYRTWSLPALTLQPLIDNAVKHNTITSSKPLRISIRTEGDRLVVSNLRAPKLEPEPSTGIGLENLKNRWRLITGEEIEVESGADSFVVRMPLQKPAAV